MKPIIVLSPTQVPAGSNITIRLTKDPTHNENAYIITNEPGKIIRKGNISKGINEFCLSVAGMATGVYRLTIGQVQERFTVF